MSKVLRDRLNASRILVAPGVFDPITALLAERKGFEAVYMSGAALSNSLALPDLGLVTLSESVAHAKRMTRAIHIPIIADVDTGFGEAINVMRTLREFEDAGVAAIHIEDQVVPKRCGHLAGKTLVEAEEMAKKLTAAVEARKDPDFMIIARTDARHVVGLEEAIDRASVYVDAGADMIFPEALESLEEFRAFAKVVKVPLMANMTEFGKTPYISVADFERIGYRFVIFPMTAFRVMLKAVKDTFEELKASGTQKKLLDRMMSRNEFYEMIDYSNYEKLDRDISDRVGAMKRKTSSSTMTE